MTGRITGIIARTLGDLSRSSRVRPSGTNRQPLPEFAELGPEYPARDFLYGVDEGWGTG
jgi:hypothetical protein